MTRNKGNISIVILVVAILGVVVAGTYYFYKSQENISINFASKKTIFNAPTPIISNTQTTANSLQNVPEYRLNVLEGINKRRLELGQKILDIDSDLCALAKILAEEKATNYPKEVTQNIFTDPKYTDYIKNYSSVQQLKFTINDTFIEVAKEKGQKISFTDDYLIEAYVNTNGTIGSPLQPELTNGCVAVSPENIGYKPFTFFVGGIKKK